jgi:molybdate transport system substrate-binding protein
MKWSGILALGLLAVGGLALLPPAAVLGAQELTVSAAASLTNAFPEIGKLFEKQHPGA